VPSEDGDDAAPRWGECHAGLGDPGRRVRHGGGKQPRGRRCGGGRRAFHHRASPRPGVGEGAAPRVERAPHASPRVSEGAVPGVEAHREPRRGVGEGAAPGIGMRERAADWACVAGVDKDEGGRARIIAAATPSRSSRSVSGPSGHDGRLIGRITDILFGFVVF
jgi:hypothetical protein